jgi:hypothetical protein
MPQPKKGIDIPGLVDAYYEDGPSRGITTGQIVWIPAFYPNRDNVVIDIDVASDPGETHLPAFLRPIAQKRNFFPVRSLNLASNEHAFVVKGKIRPAIVVVENIAQWSKSPSENIALCVPLFRVYKPKFSQAFVLKTQAFQYPNRFYLPPETRYTFEEAVARLELIQSVHQAVIQIFPSGKLSMMMTEEFFSLFSLQLVNFLTKAVTENETLETYGQLILEEGIKQGIIF